VVNPFLRDPTAYVRTPIRAEQPTPRSSGSVATLRLYDPIDSWGGDWGISAKEFVAVLDGLPDDTTEIKLLINSPGGHVWEGLAILNALRSHPAKVTAVVEGIAASAASFIAAGADELHVMPNAELMIHRAWGGCIGNAQDMQKMAADLDHEDRNLASIYAAKAGGEVDDWLTCMSEETFFSAEEAVTAGLADRVLPTPKKDTPDATAEAKARFDLSVFSAKRRDRSTPAANAVVTDPAGEPEAAPTTPTVVPDPEPELPAAEPEQEVTPDPKEEDLVSDLSEVRSRLGLDDTADEGAVLAALDALKAQADTPVTDPAVEAEVEAAKAENADLRTEVEKLGQMVESMSAKLAETETQTAAKVKASVLDEAQRLGKFKPANRAQWETDYDEAPAVTTRLLARIQPGAEVPVNTVGSAGSPEPGGNDDEWADLVARLDGPHAKAV
jgi:ATP-dependent Clp endopeptidase proteolytic subunit ClpP